MLDCDVSVPGPCFLPSVSPASAPLLNVSAPCIAKLPCLFWLSAVALESRYPTKLAEPVAEPLKLLGTVNVVESTTVAINVPCVAESLVLLIVYDSPVVTL